MRRDPRIMSWNVTDLRVSPSLFYSFLSRPISTALMIEDHLARLLEARELFVDQ